MLIWINDHCALCPSDHKTWFSLGKCMCKIEAKQEGWTCLMPSPFPRVTDPVPWGWVLSATEKTLIHPFMGDLSPWPKHLLTLLTWGIKFVTPDLLGRPLKLSYRSRRRFSGKKKAPSERKYLAMEIWWGTGKLQSGLNNSEGVWVFHSQTVRYYHWPMALIYKCKKSCLSGTKLAARPLGAVTVKHSESTQGHMALPVAALGTRYQIWQEASLDTQQPHMCSGIHSHHQSLFTSGNCPELRVPRM